MAPRRDRSIEASRAPLPAVPRAPRQRARSNSAGALSRAQYARGGSRPGSASSNGSNNSRLSRAGSGIVREESPTTHGRVNALQRFDEAQEQSLPMGPPARPDSAQSSSRDHRRGRSLSLNLRNGDGVPLQMAAPSSGPDSGRSGHSGGRVRVLDREQQSADQGMEFFPAAAKCSSGRPDPSGSHQRSNLLGREMLEKNEVPEWVFGVRAPNNCVGAGPRKNVLADEVKRAAPSCGLPRPPCYSDGGVPQYGRRTLVGRPQDIGFSVHQHQDLGFSVHELTAGGGA